MMRSAMILIVGICLLMFSSLSSFASSGRVALVIGNSAYRQVAALQNPGNDATAIGEALQRMGFEVTVIRDATKVEFDSALSAFSDVAVGADIAVVFYAGHGIEVNGINYLIPTDATLTTDAKVSFETVTLGDVLEAVRGVKGLSVVLLDACRENPFVSKMQRDRATRSIGRGLARIEATPNLLVSYSAEAGAIADDGDAEHSPYTEGLLKFMEMPDLEVNFLFRRVSAYVRHKTDGRQTPFEYSRLPEEAVYLSLPSATDAKMFLYEEGIGGTQPTMFPGSVRWSIDMRTDANGRSDPVIQAHITVPERNFTTTLKLERNADPLLSASHLIELSFQVGPGFSGGGIAGVAGMTMKVAEGDRGDPLVAVSAKIVENMHLIGLDGLPDFRAKNLELLRTRQWIDLPIYYLNGKRALLTFEKGLEGERLFNKGIYTWASNDLANFDAQ